MSRMRLWRDAGRLLRLCLLAAFLVGGQLAMLAHGAGHAGDAGEPVHACLLCIGGHDLTGAAPPPAASLPAAALAPLPPPSTAAPAQRSRTLLAASARGPPVT